MPSLTELIDDKKTYPDDRKITLADGVETTLGELRGGFMRTADYTRKTQDAARERADLAREKAEWESAKTAAEAELQALARDVIARQPAAAQPQTVDDVQRLLDQDPVARRLMDEVKSAREETKALNERIKAQDEWRTNVERQWQVNAHRTALAAIKSRDASIDEQALVDYAKREGLGNLFHAYRLMTEEARIEDRVKTAREEAAKAAYAKAKADLAQPMIPTERRIVPVAPEGLPVDVDKAFDMARQDPEILAIAHGLTPGSGG